jgi:type IV pilus assembly protein PilW
LQDSERLAMNLMTDIIQTTAYFPNPRINTLATALGSQTVASVGTLGVGQSILGVSTGTAQGDTVVIRYATASGDGILNWSGGANGTGATATYTSQFIVQANAAGTLQLDCILTIGAAAAVTYPLINNVQRLDIVYGVNSAGTGNNVDSYMTAAQVTANGDWNSVVSVNLKITFVNTLAALPAPGQGTQVGNQFQFQRTISLMNKVGI